MHLRRAARISSHTPAGAAAPVGSNAPQGLWLAPPPNVINPPPQSSPTMRPSPGALGTSGSAGPLWDRVITTQWAPRVGSKREKALAATTTAATLGTVAAIGILAGTNPNPLSAGTLISLASCNGVLATIAGHASVATFRHTRPPRPGDLRRHSFFLTGIVPRRRQARALTRWLTEQGFLAPGRERAVRRVPTPEELQSLGVTSRFPCLGHDQVGAIAETLNYVHAANGFFNARPAPPANLHTACRAVPPPWQPQLPPHRTQIPRPYLVR